MNMLVFITSVKHPTHSFAYEKVWALLEATLTSVCNQTDGSFRVIVVCNQAPCDFKEATQIHAHTEFVVVDYPPISTSKTLTSDDKKLDVGIKYVVGLLEARKYAPEYIMFFDADDLVGNDIAEYAKSHPHENGWFIDRGYLTLGNRYSMLENFNAYCGTCNILNFPLLMKHIDPMQIHIASRDSICAHVDDYFLRFILGSHKYTPDFLAKEGTPLKPFPKRAAMWLLDHGENRGGNRGHKLKLIGRTFPFDNAMRQYFNINSDDDRAVTRMTQLGRFLKQFLSMEKG